MEGIFWTTASSIVPHSCQAFPVFATPTALFFSILDDASALTITPSAICAMKQEFSIPLEATPSLSSDHPSTSIQLPLCSNQKWESTASPSSGMRATAEPEVSLSTAAKGTGRGAERCALSMTEEEAWDASEEVTRRMIKPTVAELDLDNAIIEADDTAWTEKTEAQT